MIISEQQVMQLITLTAEYSERLRHMPYDFTKQYSDNIDNMIGTILNQQSEELKDISDEKSNV